MKAGIEHVIDLKAFSVTLTLSETKFEEPKFDNLLLKKVQFSIKSNFPIFYDQFFFKLVSLSFLALLFLFFFNIFEAPAIEIIQGIDCLQTFSISQNVPVFCSSYFGQMYL